MAGYWVLGLEIKLEVKFSKCCYVSQYIFLLPQAIFELNLFVKNNIQGVEQKSFIKSFHGRSREKILNFEIFMF